LSARRGLLDFGAALTNHGGVAFAYVALILAIVLIVAAARIARLRADLAAYKVSHPYVESDMKRARDRAVEQSRASLAGKAVEHLAPLLPEMLNRFDPTDARFLGTPIDFVIFDGLDEGYVRQVMFVEVKTGRASLTAREQLVREAINDGRVGFDVVRVATPNFQRPTTDGSRAMAASPPSDEWMVGLSVEDVEIDLADDDD
jgi:hypothetical protein